MFYESLRRRVVTALLVVTTGAVCVRRESHFTTRNYLHKKAVQLSWLKRATNGSTFRLEDVGASDTAWLKQQEKHQAKEVPQRGITAITKLQEMFYARDRYVAVTENFRS